MKYYLGPAFTFTGTITAPSFSGTLNVSNLAGTLGVAQGGTGLTVATLGDVFYASAPNVLSALAGNASNVRRFFAQTGTGTVSSAPAWVTIAAGDVPDLSATYSPRAGSTALVTVGTITTGVWNGSAVPVANGGTGATTPAAALANLGALSATDPSVTNARTPTAHKSSHAAGGTDALSPADIGAVSLAQDWANAIIFG